MKQIFLIFCLISTATFASNDNPPLFEDDVQITAVSSISDVWNIPMSEDLQVESVNQNTVYSTTTGVTVMCVFDDGEYWMGTGTSASSILGMIDYCKESGGQPFYNVNKK